jgi:hypothetical protein
VEREIRLMTTSGNNGNNIARNVGEEGEREEGASEDRSCAGGSARSGSPAAWKRALKRAEGGQGGCVRGLGVGDVGDHIGERRDPADEAGVSAVERDVGGLFHGGRPSQPLLLSPKTKTSSQRVVCAAVAFGFSAEMLPPPTYLRMLSTRSQRLWHSGSSLTVELLEVRSSAVGSGRCGGGGGRRVHRGVSRGASGRS